ncbi:MAG: hydrogenase [Thermoplasmata archaeon]|nr:NADH-quinone oxidoreductase subunit B family protein [Euryarchaeota archaeon]RLF67223.1 MAG: hydrogenase [Thermoplasmata archaeon]
MVSLSRALGSERKHKLRSVRVFHVNSGACNGCDIELLDILTPFYDAERLGIKLVSTPRHAHALLVTGPLTRKTASAVLKAYEAMPSEPRIVIAIGTCACSGGIFYDSYALYRRIERYEKIDVPRRGGISELIPVDIYIPGCPPRPEEILYGISVLLELANERLTKQYYKEDSVEEYKIIRKKKSVVNERLVLSLREKTRHIIGYFDRDRVLKIFLEMVEIAEKCEDPKNELSRLIEEYCKKEKDSRIRECLRILEKDYWRLKNALLSREEVIYWI